MILKSRAPRRVRLTKIHIEAYAPRGSVHFISQAIAALFRVTGRFRSPAKRLVERAFLGSLGL